MAAVVGTAGNDILVGTSGDDSINGRAGVDSMSGGSGSDTYFVDNAADTVIEGADGGDDKVYVTGAWVLGNGQHVETLRAFTDAPTYITGNERANAIYGRSGADRFVGGLGDDYLSGAAGDDDLAGGWGFDTLLGGDGSDLLNGNDNADTLYGGNGDDQLFGGTGNDLIDGGVGTDSMTGGSGSDTYIVDSIGDLVVELNETGIDIVKSSVDYVLTTNVETLFLLGSARKGTGNAGANTITGTAGADTLEGMDGNDYLLGGVGDDYLDGGAGVNKLDGGVGNDTYFIHGATTIIDGSGNDTVILDWDCSYFAAGNVAIETIRVRSGHDGGSFYAGTKVGTTLIGGAGQEFLYGNLLNDVLISGGGQDYLYGSKGNDTLDARGAGAALLDGGVGNDTYLIDVFSHMVEAAGGGTDTVRSWTSVMLEENFEILILEGNADINGSGFEATNKGVTITGNSGRNIIQGTWGNDSLRGGAGADTFRIGFLFEQSLENDSYLDMNFSQGDRFDLSTLDADPVAAGNNAFHWVSTFTGNPGEARLSYNAAHTTTFLQLDFDGDQVIDYRATFSGEFTVAQTITGAEPVGVGGWIL